MEGKKSNNQVVENCERDFQFSDGVAENTSHTKVNQYGRDLLLQLRLHPLSLQKPKTLPVMEVVKEKLYLHDINETCSTPSDKCMDINNYPTSLKPEYCSIKHECHMLTHSLNRAYPYCFSSQDRFNGPYQSASSKLRSAFHTYCNPLKKHCMNNHQCYKDFADECLWAKRCFPSSEEMWNCYPSHVYPNVNKKKEHLEAVPKCRKKLPIIDPVTGKNVLEAVTSVHHEEQRDAYLVQENSESSESYSTSAGDYFCDAEINVGQSLKVSTESYADSITCSEDKIYYDKVKSSNAPFEDNFCDKKFGDNVNSEVVILYDDEKSAQAEGTNKDGYASSAKVGTVASREDSIAVQENTHELVKNSENLVDTSVSKPSSKKVPKTYQNRENSHAEKCSNLQGHHRKECNPHVWKESLSKLSDSLKDSLKSKDKLSLRQEQQKMAILQSFLRYKKYQLEENARNLDEKRIEIANWECNLFNKAKRLHDKEVWLESQSEILFNKAQQLAEKEKMLHKEENKLSGDCPSSKNMLRDPQFPERKFALYNCSDSAWDEIPAKVKSSFRNDENIDYSCFGYASKIPENVSSNVEKCKSDANSLDELERNIVLIEKIHSSGEVGDTSLENKAELASSNTSQKKDEGDPSGPSKGRRYLPEHIKYWLNKRDKNSL